VDFLAIERGRKPEPIADVLWGPAYDDRACERALLAAGTNFDRPLMLAEEAAELLARGKTVGRYAGAMEFGPRALGNRSILYQATDPSVNDWLNRALKRTEFMPFAPVTLADKAEDIYRGLARARQAAEFMTVTFECSQRLAEQAPAVVHVDGTARPQLVRRDTNPDYYDILAAYRRRTGLATVINTSFNMHEEPIVLSPDDAIRAAIQARLDALIMGPYLARFDTGGRA
jgi:carbamoyltransferase